MEWIFIISFAIVLAASTGIRAFLPLTITAILAKLNIFVIPIDSSFINFVTDDRVLAFLIIATVIEIISDKIPAVDNFLDVVYNIVKPLISFISSYSIINMEPWQSTIVSITLALMATSVSMGTKAAVRFTSTSSTAGIFNPLISILEDLLVIFKMTISIVFYIVLPIIAIFVIFLVFYLTFSIYKILSKRYRYDSERIG